ncbi:PilZ domain-containing protein [Rhizobium oryzicola]|uniref:PilZ domain-containing protein n=1 Tax=Rhizobium oryzicola TaxID=1232668 RepID=A0ABT8SZK1_9HYPH|nr:PilZ domain-containing protein [Rhizobium oryzicola]MDO1583624.1 PilZ domain-containing protein [Rhizobium oryzicola]
MNQSILSQVAKSKDILAQVLKFKARRTMRSQCDMQGMMSCKEWSIPVTITNLSDGGLAVSLSEENVATVGTKVQIESAVTGQVRGTVRWTDGVTAGIELKPA